MDGDGTDSTGHGYTGTFTNSVTPAVNRFGEADKAIAFPSDQQMKTLLGGDLNSSRTFSISLWFRTAWVGPSGASAIMSTRHDAWIGSMTMHNYPDGNMSFYMVDNSGNNILVKSAGLTCNDNAWHSLIATADRDARTVILYIDGSVADTLNYGSEQVFEMSGQELWFGSMYYTPIYFYTGDLDDIRVYPKALTMPEVYTLYHEGDWNLP